jgi:DNA-binding HxlR family transcriptional regulator
MRCRKSAPVPEEVRRAADLLERRYALSILYASHEGAVRFNEFLHALGPVPPGTLAARLADLAEAGVLERAVIDSRPPRVEYRVTQCGQEVRALIAALERFGRRQFPTTLEER